MVQCSVAASSLPAPVESRAQCGKLQLSSGIRKPGSSSSSHRLKPTLTTAEYIVSLCCCSRILFLLQQSTFLLQQSNPQQRPMPTTTTPPLHCFIFSHCSFTDISQKITIKVSPQKGLEWLQFHRIQRLFYLLQYTSILVLVYISIHRRMVASKFHL